MQVQLNSSTGKNKIIQELALMAQKCQGSIYLLVDTEGSFQLTAKYQPFFFFFSG